MKHGFVISDGDSKTIVELAREAEAAGWDGVFVADAIGIEIPSMRASDWYDPWVVLGAMAASTERIRIGTLITAVPRRRPWKLARETGTLDQLSDGRFIFGVGLGVAEHDGGFYKVGEPTDLKVRAQLLDEGLEIIGGLWRGKRFSFTGEHYQVDQMTMLPTTVQKPRIPVWVVGVWPKEKSLQRTLRWDGIIPQKYKAAAGEITMDVEDIRAIRDYVTRHRRRKSTPFDIIVSGSTSARSTKRDVAMLRSYREAGATWWMEHSWGDMKELRARLRKGPLRLD